MKQIEYSFQDTVTYAFFIVKISAGISVVAIINKLPGVEIQGIRPIFVFSTCIENDKFFVDSASRCTETSKISYSSKQSRKWFSRDVGSLTFIDSIYKQTSTI